ncbi:transmembrane protein, putative (macronuclear) [Tetrahymena thermophila SB210]|uniref:Transmembrane protein, putative n=1 Tax=Tetrahymena thermophila (strain SB210) TaxID=312017 RepID=W7X6H1_TETTS|nr:transmembrane protein, putative [Tetrahymena thermophila SB210]EWS74985.1 transmembrane protein, putative [Tetrahymena thermophila SB210]|eukprot:XP_012652484.1 transmembrane protein, putative [Tetrahymena thermophila SB210]
MEISTIVKHVNLPAKTIVIQMENVLILVYQLILNQYAHAKIFFIITIFFYNNAFYVLNQKIAQLGKYALSDNQCIGECPQYCQHCLNSTTCLKYDEMLPCHQSCSTCKRPIFSDSCTSCISSTRQLNIQTNSCDCIEGYQETGKKYCEMIPSPVSETLADFLKKYFQVSYYMNFKFDAKRKRQKFKTRNNAKLQILEVLMSNILVLAGRFFTTFGMFSVAKINYYIWFLLEIRKIGARLHAIASEILFLLILTITTIFLNQQYYLYGKL